MKLKILYLDHFPKETKIVKATTGSAGFDLVACDYIEIPPGERMMVRNGIKVALEPGFEMQVRPRSGLSAKNGITVLNSPGTVDSDYRGELKTILLNTDKEFTLYIRPGDRISQAVIKRVEDVEVNEVSSPDELGFTERSDGGFGSTGK